MKSNPRPPKRRVQHPQPNPDTTSGTSAELGVHSRRSGCVLDGAFGAEAWAMGVEAEGGMYDVTLYINFLVPHNRSKTSSARTHTPPILLASARAAPHRARQLLCPPPSISGASSFEKAGGITAYYCTHLSWADHLLQATLYPAPTPLKSAFKNSSTKLRSTGIPISPPL
ncbi:hypothetical protein C8R43DRAFT_1178634 [Mycena crocata]|nr:hypothetical protein C8R43DRAFT_1178634 [Mycena crocata]